METVTILPGSYVSINSSVPYISTILLGGTTTEGGPNLELSSHQLISHAPSDGSKNLAMESRPHKHSEKRYAHFIRVPKATVSDKEEVTCSQLSLVSGQVRSQHHPRQCPAPRS